MQVPIYSFTHALYITPNSDDMQCVLVQSKTLSLFRQDSLLQNWSWCVFALPNLYQVL